MTPHHVLGIAAVSAIVSGCVSAPAANPSARGHVSAHGGAFGDWELVFDRCSHDDTRVLTIDLHAGGSYHKKPFVRVTRVAADEDGTPTIDVEIVDPKARGGPQEVLVNPVLARNPPAPGITQAVSTAHCRLAEGWIAAETESKFSGKFRFVCDTIDGGKIVGEGSFAHCAGDDVPHP